MYCQTHMGCELCCRQFIKSLFTLPLPPNKFFKGKNLTVLPLIIASDITIMKTRCHYGSMDLTSNQCMIICHIWVLISTSSYLGSLFFLQLDSVGITHEQYLRGTLSSVRLVVFNLYQGLSYRSAPSVSDGMYRSDRLSVRGPSDNTTVLQYKI